MRIAIHTHSPTHPTNSYLKLRLGYISSLHSPIVRIIHPDIATPCNFSKNIALFPVACLISENLGTINEPFQPSSTQGLSHLVGGSRARMSTLTLERRQKPSRHPAKITGTFRPPYYS